MRCPKCKSEISDNVLRCPNCNLKVKIVCPQCSSINIMGQKVCKDCGYEFFVKCTSCSSVNLSESEFCRKCGESLKPNVPESEPQNEVIEELKVEIQSYNETSESIKIAENNAKQDISSD